MWTKTSGVDDIGQVSSSPMSCDSFEPADAPEGESQQWGYERERDKLENPVYKKGPRWTAVKDTDQDESQRPPMENNSFKI